MGMWSHRTIHNPIRISDIWVEKGVLRDGLVIMPAGWTSWLRWQSFSKVAGLSPAEVHFLLPIKMLLF